MQSRVITQGGRPHRLGYPSSRAPAVFRAHLLPSPVDGRAGLKEDEVADSCVEGVRYAAEIVEAHAHAACFDAPDMGLAAAHHEGELLLRQALGLPSLAYRASQERSFLPVVSDIFEIIEFILELLLGRGLNEFELLVVRGLCPGAVLLILVLVLLSMAVSNLFNKKRD